MKKTLFSKLMFYLTLFFLLLCGLTYFILSHSFEAYYLQSREDNLKISLDEVLKEYNENGNTENLEQLIERKKEEGVVIQIISPKNVTTSDNIDVTSSIIKLAQGSGQQKGQGEGNGIHEGSQGTISEINGNGNGQGSGSGNHGNGQGTGQGQQEKLENQISEHESGETFVIIMGNNDHEVEWLTYKETANDGAQIVGRIPLYSIHEVIQMVRRFLVFFLLIIFVVSIVFAYFLAKSISKPLVNLKNISREMGNLNFSEKYRGKRQDEIGELGETLNGISEELESTILKLQVELNKERTMEKMRKRFTAQVSHEIQTPLAVIKSYAEALEDGLINDEDEKNSYYRTVSEEADKVSSIASDLLDLAQIESKAYILKKEKENATELLDAVIKRYRNTYPEKNIQLIHKIEKDVMVHVDKKRMEQVFYNLLNNAIKHVTPENGLIKITSSVSEGQWEVDIYNEGQPIAENEIDQIWEYFYKAKSEKKGTGLGLAIVKGIILGHEGSTFVKNDQNGVVFKVTLPY